MLILRYLDLRLLIFLPAPMLTYEAFLLRAIGDQYVDI